MTYTDDQLEMALEWIEEMSILSEPAKAVMRRLCLQHLKERSWLSLSEIQEDLSTVGAEDVEVALDDMVILSLVATADLDDDDDTLFRISPQLAFDLDNTIVEVVDSESFDGQP
ncbi:MAG: hypothetical protein EBT03_05035 [Betaproteobacteria bacterium]|nr:hypothetical protein [Betaproteobacteria bacterium]NBT76125.1 hypothetical protein [Betaproteobacteria bacterium]NBY13444.1 hypothetical protein [Betaproteobacteria bacterium]NCA16228.1 hypothetical protein [Betaproteobacteria bacterium]NDF04388.1 hypothetical protein [Betaproteobacteria bacterium]